MPLETELAFFARQKEQLLESHEGKFALIHGETLCGTFDTPRNAYSEGVKQFGTEAFLIKQILKVEPVEEVPAFQLGVLDANAF